MVNYASRKSKRVVSSITPGKKNAFLDAFDKAHSIVSDLKVMLDRHLDIFKFMNSRQVYEAIVKGRHTPEGTLMVEIARIRQA